VRASSPGRGSHSLPMYIWPNPQVEKVALCIYSCFIVSVVWRTVQNLLLCSVFICTRIMPQPDRVSHDACTHAWSVYLLVMPNANAAGPSFGSLNKGYSVASGRRRSRVARMINVLLILIDKRVRPVVLAHRHRSREASSTCQHCVFAINNHF
jgi:hypothetical protein